MKNYAGRKDLPQLDEDCRLELEEAGIPSVLYDALRSEGEVPSATIGNLHGWTFHRAWYYWVAKGPGIPPEPAMRLHESHGKEVRVEGHCGCPSPLEWNKGFATGSYHVDTQEGLKALADCIKSVYIGDDDEEGSGEAVVSGNQSSEERDESTD